MLKARCRLRAENRAAVISILNQFGIIEDDSADISIVEHGLAAPETDIVVFFNGRKPDMLKEMLSGRLSSSSAGTNVIPGRKHHSFEPIEIENILFFRADGNYVYAVTPEAEYEISLRLYETEARFRERNFIRINKSTVVNILKIKEIIPWFGSRLLLRLRETEQRLEVSRNYLKSFREYLGM